MSGVLQGSVLGPLFFVVYVNYLPNIVQCPTKLFTDDTKDDTMLLEHWQNSNIPV